MMGIKKRTEGRRLGRRWYLLLSVAILGLLSAALVARTRWAQVRRGDNVAQARAFYYWKTQWSNPLPLQPYISQHGISRLYMRFFDVGWDEPAHAAQPLSPLQIEAALPVGVEVIPVVFIANRVFHNTAPGAVEVLADNVWRKVDKMATAAGMTLREVQLDCDWSDRTRPRYFHFLEHLRRKLHGRKLRLSSTLRLHQIKYPERTGVPPVDRGMLMFYNFGRLGADEPRSSIFNVEDAERYASYIASYTLPLDLSLPIFSWSVHSREQAVLGLIEKVEPRDIEAAGDFRLLRPGRYQAERPLFFRGRYFREGDELALEQTTPQVTRQAAVVAARGAGSQKHFDTVAFFDLDERTLRHYAHRDLQDIFALLR